MAGLLLAAAVLALREVPAQAQSPLVFGIQPTQQSASAAQRAYFTYTIEPGSETVDSLAVTNNGSEPITLKLYAADGITSINGSTAFTGEGEVRSDVRSWLIADTQSLEVPPGESIAVPFSVRVPADAEAGDHVAGWVAEAPPKAGSAGGVGAALIERAGVAVVVTIPGPAVHQLTFGRICLNQETGSNYFEIAVQNDGNVLTKAEGSLVLTTKDGDEVFSRPAELGNVVPHDSTYLRLDAPGDPGPGEYVATLTMSQPDGNVVTASSDVKLGDKKINGCTAVGSQEQEPQPGLPYVGSLTKGGTPWMILAALFGLLLLLVAFKEMASRRRPKPAGAIEIDPYDDEVT